MSKELEEAKKSFETLQEIILITFNLNEYLDVCDKVSCYLKQQIAKEERAKKVEELLKLYQEKDFVIKKYTKNSFSYLSELERLSYEIKLKEKELEKFK